MVNRVQSLKSALEMVQKADTFIDDLMVKIDYAYDAIGTHLEGVRTKLADEYDKEKAKENSNTTSVFNDLMNKAFTDTEKPAEEPVTLSHEEKVDAVRDYYREHFGVEIWQDASVVPTSLADYTYKKFISK